MSDNDNKQKPFILSFSMNLMANTGINMPSSYGGLMRYNEEFESKFMIKPTHVIIFVVAILVIVTVLKVFFPVAA